MSRQRPVWSWESGHGHIMKNETRHDHDVGASRLGNANTDNDLITVLQQYLMLFCEALFFYKVRQS